MYYQALREKLFAEIPYPADITELIGEADPWRAFCALPEETKQNFAFMNEARKKTHGDTGYCRRSRAAGREDKEYFHTFVDTPRFIEEDGLAFRIESDPILASFFQYSTNVYARAHQFALDIGREMGAEIPELGSLVERGKIKSVLRMLHYTNTPDVDVIAVQHFDRSLYTLHLYESGQGLQFLNWNMQWTDAPIDVGKTVVFSGYRMERITRGKIQKTWHRVARKDEIQDRVSLVLFVWADEVEDYDLDGRAQDMTPSYIRV